MWEDYEAQLLGSTVVSLYVGMARKQKCASISVQMVIFHLGEFYASLI